MNLKDIYNKVRLNYGIDLFTINQLSRIIPDDKIKEMFIEQYGDRVISSSLNKRSFIDTVIMPFKSRMMCIDAYNTMDGGIVFVSKHDRITHSIKPKRDGPFPYVGMKHVKRSMVSKYSTSNLSTCVKLILFDIITKP